MYFTKVANNQFFLLNYYCAYTHLPRYTTCAHTHTCKRTAPSSVSLSPTDVIGPPSCLNFPPLHCIHVRSPTYYCVFRLMGSKVNCGVLLFPSHGMHWEISRFTDEEMDKNDNNYCPYFVQRTYVACSCHSGPMISSLPSRRGKIK